MKTMFRLLFIALAALCDVAYAQTDSTSSDSTSQVHRGLYIGKGEISLNAGASLSLKSPTLTLGYGFTTFSSKAFDATVTSPRVIEVGLGSFELEAIKKTTLIARTEYNQIFVQAYSVDYGGKTDTARFNLHGARWGFHSSSGYSYLNNAQEPGLSLLHAGGLVWSYNTFDELVKSPADTLGAVTTLVKQLSEYHFGTHTGATMRYNITPALALDLCAERAMMFNDFSFFRWLGSIAVEGLSQSLLTGMIIDKIELKSPVSAPVANVLLKTALSFGLYELRRASQHFPFGGNKPMFMDMVKLSISFSY